MAVATLPVVTANEIELENRRLAVESALGSLRIEGMELEPEGREILDRFASGEMTLPEMRSAIRAYTATIV
jgi:Antitoxin VbhA